MPSVAEQLRDARERQKLSVYDVAEATKIKTDHVRALDEGNYDAFPAPVYIRGFVRTYASLVKLNVSKVMEELESELSSNRQLSQPPNLVDNPHSVIDSIMLQISKVNWPLALLLGGIVLIAVVVTVSARAWQTRKTTDPLANLGPGFFQPRQTNTGELLPLPAAPVAHR